MAASGHLSREEFPEATILAVHARELREWQPAMDALRDALGALIQSGVGRIVLDISPVEIIDSYCLGLLLAAQGRLVRAGHSVRSPDRSNGWLAFPCYRDREEALAAVLRGESDPLLLCGVRPSVSELFHVC